MHIGDEMENKEIETLKAEIERFKTEFRGTFVYDNLLLTLTDDQIFDYLSIKNNRVMFNKHQTRRMWDLWQSAKATPEGFVLVPKECPDPIFADKLFDHLCKKAHGEFGDDQMIFFSDIDESAIWQLMIEAQELNRE
jgi:hypothetical protein